MPRTIRIALLLCDTPLPLVQRELNYPTYTPVFLSHLQDTLESYPDKKAIEGVQLEVDSFDVVGKQEYPDESKVREGWYDAVMMTGSGERLVLLFSSVCCGSTYDADSQLIIIRCQLPSRSSSFLYTLNGREHNHLHHSH